MSALRSWWSRQRCAPPQASYEYPCTQADPTETLDRYASNEFRNSMSSGYFVIAMVVVAVLGWVLTEWVGFKFLMAIAAVGTAVWVLLSLVLMVGYFVRVRRLARRFWESGAAGSDQDARRRLATDIITQDLAGRRFVIRPGPAAAHEGLSNLIPLGAFASTPYMANLWREP